MPIMDTKYNKMPMIYQDITEQSFKTIDLFGRGEIYLRDINKVLTCKKEDIYYIENQVINFIKLYVNSKANFLIHPFTICRNVTDKFNNEKEIYRYIFDRYNSKKEIVGYVMKRAYGFELQRSLFIEPLRLEKLGSSWTRKDLIRLSINILSTVDILHKYNIIIANKKHLESLGWDVDYIEIRKVSDLSKTSYNDSQLVVLGAGIFKGVRLIDSIEFCIG